MKFQFEQATKEQVKARIAIVGPTGSGKTYTALTLATNMVENVAVIDTENGSASRYADEFNFQRVNLTTHAPQMYVDAIHSAENAGFDALIIDSLSHAWAGRGGALEMVDQFATRYRDNRWAAWRDITPQHNALVDALIQCQCHLIVTMRAKTEWIIQQGDKGKSKPVKVGLAPVQRDGLEYEFDIVADMDEQHNFIVSKTRCRALDNAVVNKPGEELAQTLHSWLTDGTTEPDSNSDEYKAKIDHFQELGQELYPDNWETVLTRNVHRITEGQFDDINLLTYSQVQRLIDGLYQLRAKRVTT